MSRIGKLPINIPAGVTVDLKDNVVSVKGPKGELSQAVHPSIKITMSEGKLTFDIDEKYEGVDPKQKQAFHGLYRAGTGGYFQKTAETRYHRPFHRSQ